MIELILLNYLSDVLSVPVVMERPESPASSYVLLEKTGSSVTNHIKSATFAIQSYAPTMCEAAELNENVKTALEASIILPEISAARLNSDYNYTDTASKQYRYQAVFDFIYY